MVTRFLRLALVFLGASLAVGCILWAAGALWFDLSPPLLRIPIVVAWCAAAGWLVFFGRPRLLCRGGVAIAWFALLGTWLNLQPQQHRDWKVQFERIADARIDGSWVEITNVRNFDWTDATNAVPQWEMRRFNLDSLRAVDIFIDTWGSPLLAHPIVSFDFAEGGHICFSIETRQQTDESFDPLGGLFKKFELVYVAADERDVIQLCSTVLDGQKVYVYRTTLNPETGRARFLEYVERVQDLARRPEWYNAVTHNCTTSIRGQNRNRMAWDWRILINGSLDRLLYERGLIVGDRPLPELREQAYIDPAAARADGDPRFSSIIREGRVGFPSD